MGSKPGRDIIHWTWDTRLLIGKSVAFCCYWGLGETSNNNLLESFAEYLPLVSEDVIQRRVTIGKLQHYVRDKFNSEIQGSNLRGRAQETVRRLERTHFHRDVVEWFSTKLGIDADSRVDWDISKTGKNYSKYRRTSCILLPDQIPLPARWIEKGPGILLPSGEIDQRERFSDCELRNSIALYGNSCFWCGLGFSNESNRPVGDHFYPRKRGGRTVQANCVPSCVPCNSSKGDMWPDEFWRQSRYVRLRGRLLP